MVQDDREVIHYYVNFKNATYRGYDLDKLDVSFIPYSEYDYHDHLYFKDAGFLADKAHADVVHRPGTGRDQTQQQRHWAPFTVVQEGISLSWTVPIQL